MIAFQMATLTNYDAVVIGAGHAGVEAARALAARGFQTALITFNKNKVGAMSCNPAIGGVAKSHLVYEVDAMGGMMGRVADVSAIQSRRLNLKKGPAVRSTRSQCDKDHYTLLMSSLMANVENLHLLEAEVAGFDWDELGGSRKINQVRLKDGSILKTRAVVLTAGTFMRGLMFCGDSRTKGGRVGDQAADSISESIEKTGHSLTRLKTGTPARLDARTIDFSKLDRQWGDPEKRQFSWRNLDYRLPQLCCYLTYTNERTHDIIRANFKRSALFSGDIQGVGPRYCPSVEDKVKRFPDRIRHQIFLEPEGLSTNFVYPNGMSTSLPEDVQLEFLRSIVGLEKVELLKPGYAVEYDSFDPKELDYGFMSIYIDGLFTAGQVNRTSGYEEAAAQGLWAGIQAGQWLEEKDFIFPDRSRSYMETLVDDLTTVGTQEPYRMFTSRSEYRLHLREDNAQERMYDFADSLGLLGDEQKAHYDAQRTLFDSSVSRLGQERVRIDKDRVISLFEYLRRPEVRWEDLAADWTDEVDDRVLERIEVKAKYEGYLAKQDLELKRLREAKEMELDLSVDLRGTPGLSLEVVEKVENLRPKTIFELSRISGVTPSALLTIAKIAGRRLSSVSRETIQS